MRTLSCWTLFVLSAVSPPLAASALSPLTVVVDYEQPHSTSSFDAMAAELKSIMKRVGISLEVKEQASLPPNAQFGQLVLFKMAGSCEAVPIPVDALSDERGPLAMAYASDGQILPFGEVRCDRVRMSLERTLGRGIPSERESNAYGSALGKVIAHEIYHMLAHESKHTRSGITKEALSSSDLLAHNSNLPNDAREAIRRNVRPGN